jgi:hypothetical protein
MPIFQDDLSTGRCATPPRKAELLFTAQAPVGEEMRRQISEESIRTELCEGPVMDNMCAARPGEEDDGPEAQEVVEDPKPAFHPAELIERLKQSKTSSWIPKRPVGYLIVTPNIPPKLLARVQTLIMQASLNPSSINSKSELSLI